MYKRPRTIWRVLDYLLRLVLVAVLSVLTYNFVYARLSAQSGTPGVPHALKVEIDDPAQVLEHPYRGSPLTQEQIIAQLRDLPWAEPTRLLVRIRPDANAIGNDEPMSQAGETSSVCSSKHECLVRAHPDYFDEVRINSLWSFAPKRDALVIDIVMATADVSVFYGSNARDRGSDVDQVLSGSIGKPADSHDLSYGWLSADTRKGAVELTDSELDALRRQHGKETAGNAADASVRGLERVLGKAVVYQKFDQQLLVSSLKTFSKQLSLSDAHGSERAHLDIDRASRFIGFYAFAMWWILLAALRHLLGVAISRFRNPLGTRGGRRKMHESITQIRTKALLNIEQMQLDALVVDDAYRPVFEARTHKWISEVTEVSRREFEEIDVEREPTQANAHLKYLSETWELAQLTDRSRKVLELDAQALADPLGFDLITHPTVVSLRAGFAAADKFKETHDIYADIIDQAVDNATAALRTAVDKPRNQAEVVQVLRAWDRAALELANVTLGFSKDDVVEVVDRHTWMPSGRRVVRAEIRSMQEAALERCLTPTATAADVHAGAASNAGDGRTGNEDAGSAPASSALASGRDRSARDRAEYLRGQTKPSDPVTQIRLPIGPYTLSLILVGVMVAGIVRFDQLLSGGVALTAKDVVTQVFFVCAKLLVVAVAFVLIWHWGKRVLQRNLMRRRNLERILTSALMGEDELRLEVEQLRRLHPAYGDMLERRLKVVLGNRDELFARYSDRLSSSDRHPLDETAYELAQVLRVQIHSLWRSALILRQRENWTDAWDKELSGVINCVLQARGTNDIGPLLALNTQLELGQVSGAEALLRLDDLAQPFRLARLVRALPVQTRVGSWTFPPMHEQERFISENRRTLETLTVFTRPTDSAGYVLSQGASEMLSLEGSLSGEGLERWFAVLFFFASFLILPWLVFYSDPPKPPSPENWDFNVTTTPARAKEIVILDPQKRLADEAELRRELENQRFPVPANIVVSVRGEERGGAEKSFGALCDKASTMADVSGDCLPVAARGNTIIITVYGDSVNVMEGRWLKLRGSSDRQWKLTRGEDPGAAIISWLAKSDGFEIR